MLSPVAEATPLKDKAIRFNRESVIQIWDELMPLLEEHYVEISGNLDIPLDPDKERYAQLEDQGSFVCFTARGENNELLGYAAYFLAHNLHYKSSFQAVQDVIFISKERRGFGSSFIDYCDDELQEFGCQLVYHHVKFKHDWSPVLLRKGYKKADMILGKRLDR